MQLKMLISANNSEDITCTDITALLLLYRDINPLLRSSLYRYNINLTALRWHVIFSTPSRP
ncbi:hypothetical protein D3C76_509210 [compost metagenome]